MKRKSPRHRVALSLTHSPDATLAFAQKVARKLTGNKRFPKPRPPLDTFKKHLADLEAAEQAVKDGQPDAAAARDIRLAVVVKDLHRLQDYVQEIVDDNEAEASAIIASAGMFEAKVGHYERPPLEASMGPGGLVLLRARAAPGGRRSAANEWQASYDGGKTWVPLGITSVAHIEVPGLAKGTQALFRVRAVVGTKMGDFTQPIAFVVS